MKSSMSYKVYMRCTQLHNAKQFKQKSWVVIGKGS